MMGFNIEKHLEVTAMAALEHHKNTSKMSFYIFYNKRPYASDVETLPN